MVNANNIKHIFGGYLTFCIKSNTLSYQMKKAQSINSIDSCNRFMVAVKISEQTFLIFTTDAVI